MRIVMVANWWYRRGGLGSVMLAEAQALTKAGHDVIAFAAAHDENLPSPQSAYFPPFVETSGGGSGLSLGSRVQAAADIIYNRRAARQFASLLDETEPDVIHVHNTVRQLSPSILGEAASRGIPAVMTAHDFSLVCPQGLLLKRGVRACEPPDCLGGNVARAVQYRCVKGSVAVSGLAAVENLTHRAAGLYLRRLQAVIVPSRFHGITLVRGGVPRRLLRYLPNGLPVDQDPALATVPGGQVLYLGRLAREKGLDVLLAAAARMPATPFCIAGDGPLAVDLRSSSTPNVRFTGQLDETGVAAELMRSVVVVSPSICHENAPMAVLEAMRAGRPVVASDLGGHREMLGSTGVIVPAGDDAALARALGELLGDPARIRELGAATRDRFMSRFTFQRHMAGLLAIYRDVLDEHPASAVDRGGPSHGSGAKAP